MKKLRAGLAALCRRAWEALPEVRREFRNNFSDYLAWRQAHAAGARLFGVHRSNPA